jgi:hypothetical protein
MVSVLEKQRSFKQQGEDVIVWSVEVAVTGY